MFDIYKIKKITRMYGEFKYKKYQCMLQNKTKGTFKYNSGNVKALSAMRLQY